MKKYAIITKNMISKIFEDMGEYASIRLNCESNTRVPSSSTTMGGARIPSVMSMIVNSIPGLYIYSTISPILYSILITTTIQY